MGFHSLWCRCAQFGIARGTSKHFLEGAKDRERRVRLAANGWWKVIFVCLHHYLSFHEILSPGRLERNLLYNVFLSDSI